MKKLFLLVATAISFAAPAQITQAPEGFTAGYFINANNEKSDGLVKESFKKGGVVFIAANGTKKTYTPAEINGFYNGTDSYIAYMNDFYKVLSTGSKGSLLQKVTNNSGRMLYNGTEAFAASTTQGKPGDYYLQIHANNEVGLVTKENFETVFTTACADCATLVTNIKSKQLDYTSIEKAVEQYNNCR